MITFSAARVALPALLLVLLAGCSSREQQDWHSAEAANTPEAYTRFLEQHGESELARQAQARIAQLQEERDWQRTDGIGTLEAYRQFLIAHPRGTWAERARIRIEGFSLGSAPRTAEAPANLAAGRTGVNALLLATGAAASASSGAPAPPGGTAPGPAVAAPLADSAAAPAAAAEAAHAVPVANPDPSSAYGVQLGAFASEASADREWQRLQDRFGAQLGGRAPRIVIASTQSGPLYRLQAPAGGEAEARALCDALKEQSQACVPVIPR
jgi:hypothetical protein